jgi:hypothetical protein
MLTGKREKNGRPKAPVLIAARWTGHANRRYG